LIDILIGILSQEVDLSDDETPSSTFPKETPKKDDDDEDLDEDEKEERKEDEKRMDRNNGSLGEKIRNFVEHIKNYGLLNMTDLDYSIAQRKEGERFATDLKDLVQNELPRFINDFETQENERLDINFIYNDYLWQFLEEGGRTLAKLLPNDFKYNQKFKDIRDLYVTEGDVEAAQQGYGEDMDEEERGELESGLKDSEDKERVYDAFHKLLHFLDKQLADVARKVIK
jgi:hypothetical protein